MEKNIKLNECASLSLHWSSDCNMACKYCYIDKDKKAMSSYNKQIREALKDGTYINNIKDVCENVKDAVENLSLWGAEPTINGDLFQQTIYECLDFFPNVNSIMFSTNALLGAEVLYSQFYKPLLDYAEERHRHLTFELQLSLDGPPEFNDDSRHEGATQNTLDTLYTLLKLTPEKSDYFQFSVLTKATLDISYMKVMIDGGPNKFQWYYDFMNSVQETADTIRQGKSTVIRCTVFGVPTLVDPGYYTVEDGKIFAEWLSMLKTVSRENWCEAARHAPLFYQCLNHIIEAQNIENPFVEGYNSFSCSAGKYNYSIDWDGTVYSCNRLCRNAALDDSLKFKGSMKSNSTIDIKSQSKWIKRDYANQAFHENILARKHFIDAMTLMMAKSGQINETYLKNPEARLVLFYMITSIYCHIGAEEDYTSNPFVPPASYFRLLGNGAQWELENYLALEKARGVL